MKTLKLKKAFVFADHNHYVVSTDKQGDVLFTSLNTAQSRCYELATSTAERLKVLHFFHEQHKMKSVYNLATRVL